jgi:hypothetical protein
MGDWIVAQDEEGTPFYYNSITGVSQWECPADLGQAVPAVRAVMSVSTCHAVAALPQPTALTAHPVCGPAQCTRQCVGRLC